MNSHEGSGTNSKVGLLQGRVCLITGANSGIGKATALGLARLGATVVLASRDSERGDIARRDIIRETENPEVSVGKVDLASLESIRSFAKNFNGKFPHLHVLVNNAGIYESRRIVTVDGFESTFAINHLAHFLLTNLLLESLKASAPSRIVNVTSEAQRAGHVNFDDLQGERKYSGMKSYPQSKLANVLFTYELARRLKGTEVTANCVHPGTVRTNFGRNSGGFMALAVKIFAPFMLSPEDGAKTVVWLASSPEVEHVTGKYFQKQAERKSTKESYDLNVARRLWEVSSELTGLTQT
ncbi:MAG: SDR family oxidoreductase [Candidatus Bathyarchaeia archaeon]|jgi:NAD(P)-dependent dehydrogenase (short-subunit alcohol dehydrogenase family)